MRDIRSLEMRGRRVLVRTDYNVPISEGGVITDDTRIRASLQTLRYLLDNEASAVIIATSLGRPKGYDEKLRLGPVAQRLSELLARDVEVLPFDLDEVRGQILRANQGSVLMLENLRFYPGETSNSTEFSHQLSELADVYVDDAFGTAHRAHASVVGVPQLLESAAGFLLMREVEVLSGLLRDPRRPFTALIGGAKISDKIGVINNLLPRVDNLLIGGAMANTFLLAKGLEVGKSLVERENVEVARRLLEEAPEKLVLPTDCVVADDMGMPETARVVPVDRVPAATAIFDIGSATVRSFAEVLATSGTVFWNGPMGVFEVPRFAEGSFGVARAIASIAGYTVVGGGDSVAAIEQSGMADDVDHISTGGGASLELLEGKDLPGVAVLGGIGA